MKRIFYIFIILFYTSVNVYAAQFPSKEAAQAYMDGLIEICSQNDGSYSGPNIVTGPTSIQSGDSTYTIPEGECALTGQ